jgi:hypothetical protein
VLGEALHVFAPSLHVARAALHVLRKLWPPRTERALLDAVLAAMRTHRADAVVAQAGAALLFAHVHSAAPLDGAVRVLEAIAAALRTHADDAAVAWFGALVVVALTAEEPAALAAAIGALGAQRVAALSVELAVRAQGRGGPTPALRGVPCMSPLVMERRSSRRLSTGMRTRSKISRTRMAWSMNHSHWSLIWTVCGR